MSAILYQRAATLLEAELGEELVALDPDRGNCFGFNQVATSVWRELEQPRSLDQLRQRLLAEYDVSAEQCDKELEELIEDLVQKGLVEPRKAQSATPTAG